MFKGFTDMWLRTIELSNIINIMSQDMIGGVSSDETSTIETVSTDTTLIINASKCLLCYKILGYQGKFSSDIKYHYSCLEQKNCIFCGFSGMSILCKQKGCTNAFHLFCLMRHSPKLLKNEANCGLHLQKKNEKIQDYLLTFRKIANTIQQDEEKLLEYKNFKGDIKSNFFSHGQIFWGIIEAQYFTNPNKLQQIPIFKTKPSKQIKKKSEKTWVLKAIKTLSKEIKQEKAKIKNIFKKFAQKPEKSKNSKMSEKDTLLSMVTFKKHKKFQKEFLRFIETNLKEERTEYDVLRCQVCLEDDYDDNDIIVTCSVCETSVHVNCYGAEEDANSFLSQSPGDGVRKWVCTMCLEKTKDVKSCALCPVATGVLKPTVNISSINFPTHNSLEPGTQIWSHVFCAVQIENTCVRDKSKIQNIDITSIDKKKFTEICQICKTTKGACIKCSSLRCKKYFHPECAKHLFLYTRNKTGLDDVSVYCDIHKPSKLRKNLEIKDKKLYNDLVYFIKNYEKIDKDCIKKTIPSEFSYDEKFKIYECVDSFLGQKRSNFDITIKWNGADKALRGCIEDSRNFFTFLDPNSFSAEDVYVDQHEKYECEEFYSKYIMEVMKKELKILKLPFIPYIYS
jgi:PHD-zinc-finger like domain/PHD-finger